MTIRKRRLTLYVQLGALVLIDTRGEVYAICRLASDRCGLRTIVNTHYGRGSKELNQT
jgi:hypothetical protein